MLWSDFLDFSVIMEFIRIYRLLYCVADFPLSQTTVLIFVTPVWFMFAI